MKKTVSINIGSIIFHIEEDGYEKLKGYLESINKYFSSFEDSSEIISDIESRIAEIFLEKLADGRQAVTIEDVEELIATMGTTKDFEATIESEPDEKQAYTAPPKEENYTESEQSAKQSTGGNKRLYRDSRRQKLGGVASGIAHYFSVDPLWIRLLILILFFNIFLVGLSGMTLLGYIILWIVLPANAELEEDKKVKKLFRDSDSRVLGGVASGIAKYFGSDIAVIRLLFVISIFFFGTGLLLYIILWIITPEAKTITEKMQMQGEPVTLSNIEENVKRSLNAEQGEESALVKILLFPFRLIAMVINGIGKILGPVFKFVIDLIRIFFGAVISMIGFSIMLGLIAALLGISGVSSWDNHLRIDEFPIDLIQRSIDDWTLISAFLLGFIPALAFTLVGVMIITKKAILKAYVGWSLLGLWVISLLISAYSIPKFVKEFVTKDEYRKETTYEMTQAVPVLKLNEIDQNKLPGVEIRLRGHSDSSYLFLLKVESRGSNHETARKNAESIIYNVEKRGEDFYFDSHMSFPDSTEYRFQKVSGYFYIPYGKTFRMERALSDVLVNTLHLNGYHSYDMQDNDWMFDRDGIHCLTCPEQSSDNQPDDINGQQYSYKGSDRMEYPFTEFNEVSVASFIDVDISKGETWSVVLRGEQDDMEDIYINQVGDKLDVKFKEDNWEWWRDQHHQKVGLFITMPELDYLSLVGDCDGEVKGFNNSELEINLTGGCDLYVNVSIDNLEMNLTGASTVDLKGTSERLNGEIIGASRLKAYDHTTETAEISAVGASKAEVNATEELILNATGMSKIKYRGTDNVQVSEVGLSEVERD